MAKFCENCGKELAENQDICLNCGVKAKNKDIKEITTEDKSANTGFILGLISIIAWLLPLVGYPVTICGIVSSSKGLKSSNGKGKANAGLILSIIFLIATVINSIMGVIINFNK